MSTPLISVIIPACRRADFVNQAVESVRAQTFTDVEIIVVDDASGDEVCAAYRLPDNARLIRRTTNSGRASIPRNEGARAARGRYLAFLDMDDLWLPEMLAARVAVLEARPEVGVSFAHLRRVDEALRPRAHQLAPVRLARDPYRQLIFYNTIRCPGQALIRREAFEAVGLFDEAIIGASDWDLWLRLAARTTYHADPTPAVLYRRYAGQQSTQRLVMRRGNIAVLHNVQAEVARTRPDLLPLVRRRLAGAHLRHAQALERADEIAAALRQALAVDPGCWPARARLYWEYARHALTFGPKGG